ncbi:MAG: formate dehydrogenase accessory sulfurtransferase FdhD [Polyangia bacterium]
MSTRATTTRERTVVRVSNGVQLESHERVVTEEPLAIRIDGDTLSVTMRTPGHDRELALGFLFSEGAIRTADDVSSLAHCGKDDARENTLDVVLAPGVRPPIDEHGELARRGTLVSSACGVCGRRTIDDWLALFAPLPLPTSEELTLTTLGREMLALRGRQPCFDATGGCHAATLLRGGEPIATFEDVGRHNAVDKVVGSQLRQRMRLPLSGHALLVSGRASFEIVQKAVAAGIGIVASVSAPSSLAIELADSARVTLVGFVREGRATVYTHGLRVGIAT